MQRKYVVWFEEVDKHSVGIVGGKGANLGEMLQASFPVPYGFVVTSAAYFYLLEHNNLHEDMKKILSYLNFENPKELSQGSEAIKRMIKSADVPKDLLHTISHHYFHLVEKEAQIYKDSAFNQAVKHLSSSIKDPLVAVRSSATAEDLPDASFAGQQETFLNVQGENNLIDKVRSCWASLFTERAMYYRHHQNYDHMKVGLAAVVQRMVQSEKSGIAFSIDPISNSKEVVTIESIYGLGEYIVGGKVTPDHYEVRKNDLEIIKKEVKQQHVQLVKKGAENQELKISAAEGNQQKLDDKDIQKLAELIMSVEKHYNFPQDIEWAYEKGMMYIVQSRPITTMHKETADEKLEKNFSPLEIGNHEVLVTGAPASPGFASGKPVIIHSPDEIDKIKEGDILVAPMTDPDYVPAMKRAAAIVTELGGRTSHAAIVSRELKIPAVVGAEHATKILGKEEEVTVNGLTGEVFKGQLKLKLLSKEEKREEKKDALKKIHTHTKVYINLAQVGEAEEMAKMDVDGIGLMRAEFIMADIGTHPKLIVEEGKQKMFIDKLAGQLEKVVKPFSPRPVVYRATDFKSNEYRNLEGGKKYEPVEENPMLGFRGASRYIVWKEVFDMELEAIKKVRNDGYKNLHLMIPFVRTPFELQAIKTILREHGLLDLPSFKLWMMVEVPSAVILLDEFLEMGIEQGKCARFISHKAWDHLTLAAKEKTDFRKVDPRKRFKANFDPFRYSFDNHQPPFTHPEIDVLNIDHAKSSIKL
jgi:pyruvate,water dikinase